MTGNIPPDKGKYSAIAKNNKGGEFLRHSVEQLPSSTKSRWYRLRMRSEGFRNLFLDNFKFVKVCVFKITKIGRKTDVVLNVGFDTSSIEGENEYKTARTVRTPSGSIIRAVPDELLVNGVYIPSEIKKIYLEGVPFELFQNREQISSALGQYAILFGVDHYEWISERGCYCGKVAIEVESFKSKPPRTLDIAFQGQTISLSTFVRGYDTSIKTEATGLGTTETIKCFYCKGNHMVKDCEKKKGQRFKWKCSVCNSDTSGCYENNCKTTRAQARLQLLQGQNGQQSFKRSAFLQLADNIYASEPASRQTKKRQELLVKLKNAISNLVPENGFTDINQISTYPNTLNLVNGILNMDYIDQVVKLIPPVEGRFKNYVPSNKIASNNGSPETMN